MKSLWVCIVFLCSILIVACSGGETNGGEENVTKTESEKNELAGAVAGGGGGHPYFIHLSDIHLNEDDASICHDRHRKCSDTGTDLWKVTQDKLTEIMDSTQPPAFLLFTGDLPAHYGLHYLSPGSSERDDHNQDIGGVLDDMAALVDSNDIPLLYVPGNNDPMAGDYYSFEDAQDSLPYDLVDDPNAHYPALNVNPSGQPIPNMVSDQHNAMGYYCAEVTDGLRVICLNSVILFNSYHEVDGISHTDAGTTQLKWLRTQLVDARNDSDKVFLAMHIPPGKDAYNTNNQGGYPSYNWAEKKVGSVYWQDYFLNLMDSFSVEVTGIFYGHTHMDELRLLYNKDGSRVTEVAVSAPGITPRNGNNPGFKLVQYDHQSKEAVDNVTYYTSGSATTSWGNNKPYTFSKVFGKGKSIYDVVANMDTTLVNQKMASMYEVGSSGKESMTIYGLNVKYRSKSGTGEADREEMH